MRRRREAGKVGYGRAHFIKDPCRRTYALVFLSLQVNAFQSLANKRKDAFHFWNVR
jgi:hypothetical protein